jgi:hypothetical protein
VKGTGVGVVHRRPTSRVTWITGCRKPGAERAKTSVLASGVSDGL